MSVPRPLPESAGKEAIHPGGCLKGGSGRGGDRPEEGKGRAGVRDRRGERDAHGLARRKTPPDCGCSNAVGCDTISKGAMCWAPEWHAVARGGGPRGSPGW